MKVIAFTWAFAAYLLMLAVAAIVVGAHDASIAQAGIAVTASSAVLLVVGVVLLLAAYQLIGIGRRSRWRDGVRPPCRPIVLVAFLLAILVCIYVFFSAIRTASTQRTVVVAVALALVLAAVAGLGFFGRDARVTLPRVGTIALGLVGTTIGAWEFWYQNQYVPSRAGHAVELRVDLRRAGEPKAYDVIRVALAYEDVSGNSVSVIGSTYTLTGSRVVRCHRVATAAAVRPVFEGSPPDPQRSRFMAEVWEEQPATVLAAGKFVGDGKRLDAGVSASRELVFFVPRGRYQLLRFRAQLFAIPSSVQLSQRTLPVPKTYARDNDLYEFWHIDDQSWLHDLIYGRERWVVLRYELVRRPAAAATSPDLRVTARFPEPTWSEGMPRARRVKRLFAEAAPSDASEPFADSELALGAVTKPTVRDYVYLPRACRHAT